ncbi:hypothetical protein [Ammoniphilus resinae]|uniref:Secreted protein n=1 Tax=Ammoniphilus resinae TaxID=861532 RepID=A0ABS4GJK5_9BACL|nr:hypothetical protein [Ammoniphilus resinae]MBP1930100.1 hypothetical protein [Ammoniphilus resinae]
MKTKTKTILIILLILSNVVWGSFYFVEKGAKESKQISIYSLNGSGEKWEVKNYKIVVTPSIIVRGTAELTFKGDPEEVEESDFYEVKVYERNHRNENVVVLGKSASSSGGYVNLLENVKDIGSISGPYSYDETLRTKDDYEASILEINWNDGKGNTFQEQINLDIVNEITIDQ